MFSVLIFQLHRLLRVLKFCYQVASSHLPTPQILRVLKLYCQVASSHLPAPWILRVLKLYHQVIDWRQGTWGRELGQGTGGQGTGGQQTGDRELGTGTANWGQGTWDREVGAGNWGQGTGTGNWRAGNWGQQTGDRELGTGNWGQGTGGRELELGTGNWGQAGLISNYNLKSPIKAYRWISDEADLQLCRTSMHRLLFFKELQPPPSELPKKVADTLIVSIIHPPMSHVGSLNCNKEEGLQKLNLASKTLKFSAANLLPREYV